MCSEARDRVFVNDELGGIARKIFSGFDIVAPEADSISLGACTAAMVWPFRVPPETWSSLRGVRVVQTLTAGADGVRYDLIPREAVVLSNAGAYSDSVGEHAWGLLLGAAKGLHLRKVRSTPRLLRGRTLLVVGCGAIGSEVARLARVSLAMRIIGVSRSFKHPEFFDERYPTPELARVVGSAEAILLALPLTINTRSLFDYNLLSRTRDSVIIANVGRGETVDEGAMYRFLAERPESRYVTDVYWEATGRESYETSLWNLPNFLGTIHSAGFGGGRESMDKVKERAARNLVRYLLEGRADNMVDKSEYERLRF